jgi:hypothetical protein
MKKYQNFPFFIALTDYALCKNSPTDSFPLPPLFRYFLMANWPSSLCFPAHRFSFPLIKTMEAQSSPLSTLFSMLISLSLIPPNLIKLSKSLQAFSPPWILRFYLIAVLSSLY